MKILGFGLNGMVGTRVVQLLHDSYQFENVSRATGIDIVSENQVLQKISTSDAPIIFNFAAKTNVDACELDKTLGESGETWRINVNGVKNIVDACQKTGKKLLHISTDFVFDGENAPSDGYSENDTMNPINWYGITKAKADELIMHSNSAFIIIRLAFPYTFLTSNKHFVSVMYSRLLNGQKVAGITDEKFTPTWIDDIALLIDSLLHKNATGLYHVGGTQITTPYGAALAIAETFAFNKSLISPTTREKYFSGKATRPFNTSLKNDKIKKLGLSLISFDDGLRKIASSLRSPQ